MKRVESEFQFAPFSAQEGLVKRHTIVLPIEFPDVAAIEGRSCPHCNAPLRPARVTHRFGWGDTAND